MTWAQSLVFCCTGRPGPFPETTAPHSPTQRTRRVLPAPESVPTTEEPVQLLPGEEASPPGRLPACDRHWPPGSRPRVGPAPWPMRLQCTGVRAFTLCFPGRCLLPGSVDVLGQGDRSGGAHPPATQGLR